MATYPPPENCEFQFLEGNTLNALCGGSLFQQPYANMCQRIYYDNGSMKCIPKGAYQAVCSGTLINGTGDLVADCMDGQGKRRVVYDMSKWKGQSLVYNGGTITYNNEKYEVAPSSINSSLMPAPLPVPCTWLQGDCLYDDLPNGYYTRATPEDCEKACRSRPDCRYAITSPSGECFLKGQSCMMGRGDMSKKWCSIR